jgi:hypothetical protein
MGRPNKLSNGNFKKVYITLRTPAPRAQPWALVETAQGQPQQRGGVYSHAPKLARIDNPESAGQGSRPIASAANSKEITSSMPSLTIRIIGRTILVTAVTVVLAHSVNAENAATARPFFRETGFGVVLCNAGGDDF